MEENIFLFVPNLIGYARIILALTSFYFMLTSPAVASSLYILSVLLDNFDGWAARKFNQTTMFGAVLDLVTDRCAGTCLILALGYFYPSYLFLFQLVVALDISSHWMLMCSSLIKGESSHKVVDNLFLNIYYSEPVLTIFCIGHELFFVFVYIAYFSQGTMIPLLHFEVDVWVFLAITTFPIAFLKQCINVIQLAVSCQFYISLEDQSIGRKTE